MWGHTVKSEKGKQNFCHAEQSKNNFSYDSNRFIMRT